MVQAIVQVRLVEDPVVQDNPMCLLFDLHTTRTPIRIELAQRCEYTDIKWIVDLLNRQLGPVRYGVRQPDGSYKE